MISVFLGISCTFLMCQDNVSSLLPVFEEFLKNAPQDASYDSVRQSVVILMGSLAKHLDKNDPKVKPIVAKLITALSTPSQQVKAYFGSFSTHSTCTTPIFTTSSCVVCRPSPGPGVCCQLFASFGPRHQRGCCRDC